MGIVYSKTAIKQTFHEPKKRFLITKCIGDSKNDTHTIVQELVFICHTWLQSWVKCGDVHELSLEV